MATTLTQRPKLYRQIPQVVEAMQWDGTDDGADPIINWLDTNGCTHNTFYDGDEVIKLATPEGLTTCGPGDVIIKHPNHFQVLYQATFTDLYEKAEG